MHKTITFFLLVVFAVHSHESARPGSIHLEKGSVVRLDGDTVHGFIYNRSEAVISKGIQFTTDSNLRSNIVSYSPADLKGFFFDSDKLAFESVEYSYKKDSLRIAEKSLQKSFLMDMFSYIVYKCRLLRGLFISKAKKRMFTLSG
jgi:hypothetical protein